MLLSLEFQQLLAISLRIIFHFHISTFHIYSCSTGIGIGIISPTPVSFYKLVNLPSRDVKNMSAWHAKCRDLPTKNILVLCQLVENKTRTPGFSDTSMSTVVSLVSQVARLWTSQKQQLKTLSAKV